MIRELIQKNRSIRGYDNLREVTMDELRELIDCARLSASSVNMQPLKYVAVNSDEGRNIVLRRSTSSLKFSLSLVTTLRTFIPITREYSIISVKVGMNIAASAPGFALSKF